MDKSYPINYYLNSAILFILTIIMVGCGGIERIETYSPVSPVIKTDKLEHALYETKINKKNSGSVSFIADEVTLTVKSVWVSRKLTWVIGPLILIPTPFTEKHFSDLKLCITVNVDIKQGKMEFNPKNCIVLSEKKESIEKPWSVQIIPPKHRELSGSNSVVLISKLSSKYEVTFNYDIYRPNLAPFVFRFDSFNINGKVMSIPEVPFKLKTYSISS